MVVFQQPSTSGIADGLYVAYVDKGGLPQGSFGLVSWNRSLYTGNGDYVAATWDVGSQTGFAPTAPATAQLATRNVTGSTAAQMEGDAVGAYLNYQDMESSKPGQAMMISPQYIFPAGAGPVAFPHVTSTLTSSMQLQVPVAAGNDTFVNADFLFLDPNGMRLSYAVKIFSNGHETQVLGSGYDSPSNSYMLNCPLFGVPEFITPASSSAAGTGTPWLGWRTFQWSINQTQFAAAIRYMQQQYPGKVQTTDPAQWSLGEVHLNAQFIVEAPPAELGWSMRSWQVTITD